MRKRYKKSLKIYTLVLTGLCLIFLGYIFTTLYSYEKSLINNMIMESIQSLTDKEIETILEDNKQSKDLVKKFKDIIHSDDYKIVQEEEELYIVNINGRKMFEVETKSVGEKTKLAILTYMQKEIVSIEPNLERGLLYYDVTIPSNWAISLDGEEIPEAAETKEFEDLEFMYQADVMPTLNTYELDNIDSLEDLVIKDFNGNDYDYSKDIKSEYEIVIDDFVYTADSYEEAKEYLDGELEIMDYVHDWSLFLTRDLTGTRYGYYHIETLIVDDTELHTMAYNWAHSIDITFTSRHTLRDPAFTNEVLDNFVIYGDDAFSCEVYTEKNMVVNGKDQKDIMHDYVYFVKVDDTWKMINIKPAEENKDE